MSFAEFWHRGNKFFVEASKWSFFMVFLIVRHFEECLQNFSKGFQCHQVFCFVTWHLCWLVWFEKVGCNSDVCVTIVIWMIKTAENLTVVSPYHLLAQYVWTTLLSQKTSLWVLLQVQSTLLSLLGT